MWIRRVSAPLLSRLVLDDHFCIHQEKTPRVGGAAVVIRVVIGVIATSSLRRRLPRRRRLWLAIRRSWLRFPPAESAAQRVDPDRASRIFNAGELALFPQESAEPFVLCEKPCVDDAVSVVGWPQVVGEEHV